MGSADEFECACPNGTVQRPRQSQVSVKPIQDHKADIPVIRVCPDQVTYQAIQPIFNYT